VNIVETSHSAFIVVGIGNEANRAHDYVPPNTCTPNGGGEAAFLDFIRTELIPFCRKHDRRAPTKRALLALARRQFCPLRTVAQAPADSSLCGLPGQRFLDLCMPATVAEWEQDYAAGYADLPVRLHVSYSGNVENPAFAQPCRIATTRNLTVEAHDYVGGHIGMIPAAFTAALAFAFRRSTSGLCEDALPFGENPSRRSDRQVGDQQRGLFWGFAMRVELDHFIVPSRNKVAAANCSENC